MTPNLEKKTFPKKLYSFFEKHGEIIKITKKDNADNFIFNLEKKTYCFLSGLVKVYVEHECKKIFLFHLPNNKISFASLPSLKNEYNLKFKIEIIEDTTILINSNKNILELSHSHTILKNYIINSYQHFFLIMLKKIQEFTQKTLEDQLLNHLKLKATLYKQLEIVIPIQELATDLNFSREAISRSLKKLECDHKIIRKSRSIILLDVNFQSLAPLYY